MGYTFNPTHGLTPFLVQKWGSRHLDRELADDMRVTSTHLRGIIVSTATALTRSQVNWGVKWQPSLIRRARDERLRESVAIRREEHQRQTPQRGYRATASTFRIAGLGGAQPLDSVTGRRAARRR